MKRAETAALRRALLRWYDEARRDLPWRRTSDPYAIWVSEIMLQQTRVETVIPYYARFLERFPDLPSLAAAGEDEVLAQWTGLGYYRRARSLHAGARAVLERFDGELPSTVEELQSLPGIGRYTAGAVASIAFDAEAPILDGNVRRVFARLYATGGDGEKTAALDRRIWKIAEKWVRGARPGDFNQALMELGATVCTPSQPDCENCPIRSGCAAAASGNPEDYPAAIARARSTRHDVAVAIVRRGGKILLERPGADNPLRGSWELPATLLADSLDAAGAAAELRESLHRRHGLELRAGKEAGAARHGIMTRLFRLRAFPATVRRGGTHGNPSLQWVEPEKLGETAVSGATLKSWAIVDPDPENAGGATTVARSGNAQSSSGSRTLRPDLPPHPGPHRR